LILWRIQMLKDVNGIIRLHIRDVIRGKYI
jgi:hypothetical protein